MRVLSTQVPTHSIFFQAVDIRSIVKKGFNCSRAPNQRGMTKRCVTIVISTKETRNQMSVINNRILLVTIIKMDDTLRLRYPGPRVLFSTNKTTIWDKRVQISQATKKKRKPRKMG